ncbi:MAG: winged helix-turn-helix domain-containing protein [Sulfolobales archaeon]|nr:winged helix-turn-helix domain-containing protein [Sulfolobales archaeon]MDW8083370.1 winged helix-turn-helix domain-containing protein [Sulfolobales archaeon]
MSVESKIIKYLKENPGATPRLIADALGLPMSQVRLALSKLRDSGYVVRVPGEGYFVRVAADSRSVVEVEVNHNSELKRERGYSVTQFIERIREAVDSLTGRVDKLEKEVKEIKLTLEALSRAIQEPRQRVSTSSESREDIVVKELKSKKIMKISELLAMATKPLEEYIETGVLKIVSDLAVYFEFYNYFVGRFPIGKLEVSKLSSEERELMNAMIKEGMVYLHSGREYRLVLPQS